jgi:hypothetical protein
MAIMLTVDQIPAFWEAIKFASINVDQVEEEFRGKYFNRLLYQLLSGKAQCFVELNSDRKLRAVAITKVMTDEIRDESTLLISCVYAFEKRDKSTWDNDMKALYQFAKRSNCKIITCWAATEKVAELVEQLGMKERFKSFIMEVI